MKFIKHGAGIPPAAGSYSPGVIVGNTFYLSGQIALLEDGTLLQGDAAEQTTLVMKNIAAVLKAGGTSFSNVAMVQILLADVNDFKKVDVAYASALPEGHFPARVTYQAGALPLNALVEIQVIAVLF